MLQGKYDEAEPLYVRAMAIDEKVYGPDHPEVATDLNNRAGLLSICSSAVRAIGNNLHLPSRASLVF